MAMTRRQWLKTGVAGGALLAVAGWTTRGTLWGKGSRQAQSKNFQYEFLTHADYQVLQAIIPVMVSDVFDAGKPGYADLLDETIYRFDRAVSGFYPAVQNELRQLFSLLTMPPGRIFGARLWRHWSKVRREDVEAFLNRWRTSRWRLLQSGYDALQQLSVSAWYGNPKSWEDISYPGPPKLE